MNILFVTQFLSKTKGGGEYVFSTMANALADRGHNVWIITHKIENEDYTHLHKNIKILFVSSIKYQGGIPPSFKDNILFVTQAMIKGIQIVKKEKIDLIHSNNFSPALASSIISSITRCPHVTAVWDIFSLCGKDYWTRWAEQKNVSKVHAILGPKFEKMILRMNHDAIQTLSEASKSDLIKFGARKPIYITKPAINENMLETQSIRNNLQFVYVGRLVFYKNIETILRALAIVKKSYDKVQLKIVGGGPHKDNLMRIINELKLHNNVEFYGHINESEKYKIISSSIAMLFPSLCEGFGLVILESFSCECPIIVSDVRPLSDIVHDKKNGFVINPMNEVKWSEVMMYLIRNPEVVIRIGKEGKKTLYEDYTLDNMVTQIEFMYNNIIKKQ